MNKRQRQRANLRRAHHARALAADRPRLTLDRKCYPEVKSAHIVPRMFQRPWAVDDQVAVHVDGKSACVLMSTRKAGTRARYYRRVRPNGQATDDIEASLSVLEDVAREPLGDLIAGASLTAFRKGTVAQLLGLQMLRGPAFFAQREELIIPTLQALEAKDFKPSGLASAGGDVEKARQAVISAYLDPTARLMMMLTTSLKMATLLGHMRWHIVQFDGPLLAYSDHPVVLWPMQLEATRPFKRQGLAPMAALEIRVPIAPNFAIMMNWIDRSDEAHCSLPPTAAGELNAFTVAQADRQWMHQPGNEPDVPRGVFSPISRAIDPTYDRATMLGSVRRATAERFLERVKNRQHVHDVEVIIDVDLPGARKAA